MKGRYKVREKQRKENTLGKWNYKCVAVTVISATITTALVAPALSISHPSHCKSGTTPANGMSDGYARVVRALSISHMCVLCVGAGVRFSRRHGYRGPLYCKSCSESFRSHLLIGRHAKPRSGCTRAQPCNHCSKVRAAWRSSLIHLHAVGERDGTDHVRCDGTLDAHRFWRSSICRRRRCSRRSARRIAS